MPNFSIDLYSYGQYDLIMAIETGSSHVRSIISPSEAAARGYFPREYAELAMGVVSWGGILGDLATAELMRQLTPNSVIQTFPRYTTGEGHVVVSIERRGGPKATAKDYLTYGWTRLRNALPF